jgi:hypothetical protein
VKLQREDLSKVKQMLIDTNTISSDKANKVIQKMLRFADPDLDVAMVLNGFATQPLTDKAATLYAQRKSGSNVSLGTSYSSASLLNARKLVEPYYDTERYVWAQPKYVAAKAVADHIAELETGTIEQKTQADALLKKNPLVVQAREVIAYYKKILRARSKELDYYISVFG